MCNLTINGNHALLPPCTSQSPRAPKKQRLARECTTSTSRLVAQTVRFFFMFVLLETVPNRDTEIAQRRGSAFPVAIIGNFPSALAPLISHPRRVRLA
jgi:hypothetical protein